MHILSGHTISRENSRNRPLALLSCSQTDLFGKRKNLFGFPSEKQALKRGDGSTGVQGWTIKITTGKICVSVRPLNLSVVNWKITEPLSGATIKPFFPQVHWQSINGGGDWIWHGDPVRSQLQPPMRKVSEDHLRGAAGKRKCLWCQQLDFTLEQWVDLLLSCKKGDVNERLETVLDWFCFVTCNRRSVKRTTGLPTCQAQDESLNLVTASTSGHLGS